MPYKAFISYSHAADGKLAPALQSALQGFAKPWYQRRAIRIFRDATNLAANPGLWSEIVTALGQSEYFLLLASPEAAERHGGDRIRQRPVLFRESARHRGRGSFRA